MYEHNELFSFYLAHGQSISPGKLRALWAKVCQTDDIDVGRKTRRNADGTSRDIYFLYASSQLKEFIYFEDRLRNALSELRLTSYIKANIR